MEFLFLYVVNHCFQLVRKFVSNCTRLHDVIKIKINKKLRDSAKIRAHAEKFWSKTHKKLPQFRRAQINWRMKINNIYVFYRDDNGGFIKDTILRVRTCCLDETALAFNALTKRGSTLAASGQHHI